MFTENSNNLKILAAFMLILGGVIGRLFLVNYVGIPNFEMITALTLISAVFVSGIWTFVVPLSIIAISDMIIGNSPILFFTWSAFAIIGAFGWVSRSMILSSRSEGIRGIRISGKISTVLGMTALGIGSSVFFFLYTNFGWWLISNMYSHTLSGLIQSFVMGVPFFRNNLMGNLVFVPLLSIIALFVKAALKEKMWGLSKILALGKN